MRGLFCQIILFYFFLFWFNIILGLDFFSLCFKPHYHTLPYPKTKENNTGADPGFFNGGRMITIDHQTIR